MDENSGLGGRDGSVDGGAARPASAGRPEAMPRAPARLVVNALEGETLVYDPLTLQAHCLGRAAALVFALCDGRTLRVVVADMLERELACDDGLALLEEVLRELCGKGLVEGKVRPASAGSRRRFLAAGGRLGLAAPLLFSIAAPSPASALSRPAGVPELLASGGAPPEGLGPEGYDHLPENPFRDVRSEPVATFSVDVDTASYSNVRRFLASGKLPPPDAVRIEELLNYFSYDYPEPPADGPPFEVAVELADCPWQPAHRLLHLGLQARRIDVARLPPRNLAFLVDVSGSMDSADKLPLVKAALRTLVDTLTERDRVAIAVYAGAAGVVLPPTSGADRARILEALDRLAAGGSTNGGEGIVAAYALAEASFDPRGINRVILASDGDFNVGVTTRGGLLRLVEEKRERGVFLTVLGFGTGNLKDSTMEQLADAGNGNYAYVDSLAEARRVLVEQAGATLFTVAKDVKLQVEFNPSTVGAYRLVGYENRILDRKDFEDDRKDAGEIGAGHSVTALFELVGPGEPADAAPPLRYRDEAPLSSRASGEEVAFLKIRSKPSDGGPSRETSVAIHLGDPSRPPGNDFRFAAGVAAFGMLLRESRHAGQASFPAVLELASGALGRDPGGYRREFLELVRVASRLGAPVVIV